MARFETKIKRARFVVEGYTPEQMITVGTALRDSVERRILQALDLGDAPAPPLKQPAKGKGYPWQKAKRGMQPIRDWKYTGRTLRSMKVLSAQANKAIIGFTDDVANMRAFLNNRRWRQFGVSPRDQRVLTASFRMTNSPVKAKAA